MTPTPKEGALPNDGRELKPGHWPFGFFDANEWVQAYNETLVKRGHQPEDPEFIRAWFASAIMTGHDEGRKRERENVQRQIQEQMDYLNSLPPRAPTCKVASLSSNAPTARQEAAPKEDREIAENISLDWVPSRRDVLDWQKDREELAKVIVQALSAARAEERSKLGVHSCNQGVIENLERQLAEERKRFRKIVEAEEEFLGEMPDEMWATISKDRDACTESHRIAVRLTKQNILSTLDGETRQGQVEKS